jgi:hypothetical protein
VNGSASASPCAKCGQHSPIVLRGIESRCAACGAPRSLLAGPNLSLAGQPSRWGGVAASIAGVSVLVLGLSLSLGVWFLLQSIFPTLALGWAFAVPMGAASLLLGLLLLLGGRRLRKRGEERQRSVQLSAVKSLVQHRRGPISAHEVAGQLELPEAQVDSLLTTLAREQATSVLIDVDEAGHVVYDFDGDDRRFRVLEEQAEMLESQPEQAWRAERRK